VVVTSILAGMSQRGSGADALVSESLGMKTNAAASAPITIGASQASDRPAHSKKTMADANPREPARRAHPQQPRRASLPYKRQQKTACAPAPVIEPMAAAAAKLTP
jgi:hypothetical protein